jgi:hypothetical protein
MKNRLVAVGFLSGYECYLNVSREEAVRRYKEYWQQMKEDDRAAGHAVKDADYEKEEGKNFDVKEFEFDDRFSAYDVDGPEQ